MLWLSIATTILGIALIVHVRKEKRMCKRSTDLIQVQEHEIKRMKEDLRTIKTRCEEVSEENKSLREVVVTGKHVATRDEGFIYGGYLRTHFGNGAEINDKFLEYVGDIALKTIASELPEEIRTQEVIKEVLRRGGEKIKTKKIAL